MFSQKFPNPRKPLGVQDIFFFVLVYKQNVLLWTERMPLLGSINSSYVWKHCKQVDGAECYGTPSQFRYYNTRWD